jgi:hypothetical protein
VHPIMSTVSRHADVREVIHSGRVEVRFPLSCQVLAREFFMHGDSHPPHGPSHINCAPSTAPGVATPRKARQGRATQDSARGGAPPITLQFLTAQFRTTLPTTGRSYAQTQSTPWRMLGERIPGTAGGSSWVSENQAVYPMPGFPANGNPARAGNMAAARGGDYVVLGDGLSQMG